MQKSMLGRVMVFGAAAVAALTASLSVPPAAWAADAKQTAAAKSEPAKTRDELVLQKNGGSVVKGQIVEESATSVTIMVEFGTMPPVKTTYLKSEIVEIRRDLPVAAKAEKVDATGTVGDPAKKADDKTPDRIKEQQAPTASAESDAAKIMVINLEKRLGWDISVTPMEELFEAIDKEFGDTDTNGDVKPERRESNILVFKMDCSTNPRQGFDGFFTAEKLAPLLEKQFVRGRRIVFWVDNAGGGAGFLPLISPEIYWTSQGQISGAGTNLDTFDLGDKMVNEKQISLRLGHAEGMPIKGGYGSVGVAVVRALARKSNWLTVRMEGGKPVILEREPTKDDGDYNWIILKDNGEGPNKDTMKTKGNDFLSLEADWARNLGISKGTADTVEDLAFAFGVQRNYVEIEKPKSQKVLKDWSEEVETAFRRSNPRPGGPDNPIGTLWRDLNDIKIEGDYNKRRQQYSRQINLLRKIQADFRRYAEVWDPEGQTSSQIDIRILEIEQRMEQEKKAQQGGGR